MFCFAFPDAALILFFYNLSVQEDRFLLNQFGESWLAWKDKTNAFLPKKPDTKLQDFLQMDAQEIFSQAKYSPKFDN